MEETKDTESIPDEESKESAVENDLTEQLSTLNLTETANVFLCDAGYGLPSEARPRREKILAICRQLHNFLTWQVGSCCGERKNLAHVKIVGSPDVVKALRERWLQLLSCGSSSSLPSHVEFCSGPLEDCINGETTVYLSPDAAHVLDPSQQPPSIIVVGLLIDRRVVQPNRSQKRACFLNMPVARLALDEFSNISPHEPLNVDTVMEVMQQWWWNCESGEKKEGFIQAATQAIDRHCQRHPNRPLHRTT